MTPEIHFHETVPEGWDELVALCPWGSFYHAKTNLDILITVASQEVAFLTARLGGEPVGGVAFSVQDGPFGPVVNSLPFFGSYGDAIITPEAPEGTEEVLYMKLLDHCRAIDALCLNVITSPFADRGHHRAVRAVLRPTFVDERNCQITELPEAHGKTRGQYEEEVFALFEGRARTAYRKVLKADFERRNCLTRGEALEFARIHCQNIGGKGGIFKTDAFFLHAFERSREDPGQAELAVVLDRGRIVAGVVLFYHGDAIEYHTTCLLEEYRSIGPLNLIIVDLMVDKGLSGYRRWNFGGTWKTQEGVYKFKKSFGARDFPYFYCTVFFRDLGRIRKLTLDEIQGAYPFNFVMPFTELDH